MSTIEIVLVLLATIWWLWWRLPQRQIAQLTLKIRDPKARADVEDNFRKTIGQALGGIAVLFGAVAAYLQFTQQQNAAHDLLISNQIAKGFEQLGSDKPTVRLGGIYGLEGVMNGSPQYHQPVLEALCAFVRIGTIGKEINDKAAPATDIQAVLTVIGRRDPSRDILSIFFRTAFSPDIANLAQVKIPHADLHGANLFHADLSSADLGGANLFIANLTYARLTYADLSSAKLIYADLSSADLSNTDLRGANLLSANLTYANLTHAKLDGQAQLDQACGKPDKLPDDLKLDKPCSLPEFLPDQP